MSGAEDRRDLSWLGVVGEVRTALAEAGHRQDADGVPPGVLARLVTGRHWMLAEAAEHARLMSNPVARLAAFIELAGSADGPEAERLWIEAISLAATLPGIPERDWELLSSRLPPALSRRALDAVAGIRDLGFRVGALTGLLPQLPAELLPDAFALVAGISPTDDAQLWQAEGLLQVARRLPLDLVTEAFELADAITSDQERAYALLGLTTYLPAGWPGRLSRQRRRDLVAELVAARGPKLWGDAFLGGCWQDLFSELLADELLADAVAAAGAIGAVDAVLVLAGLAPRLPGELLEQARSVADSLPAEERAQAMVGILPHLLDDARLPGLAGLLADVTARADAEPERWARRSFYPPITPAASRSGAPNALLTRTWAAVTALADGWQRDYVIARLCPRLPGELLPEAVAQLTRMLADSKHDSVIPGHALAALAPRLDEALLAQAWRAGMAARHPDAQEVVLARLAPHLPASLVPRALRDASRLPLPSLFGSHVRYAVLRGIAPQVPDKLVTKAVDALMSVSFDRIWDEGQNAKAAEVLAGLVSRLPGPQQHDVLQRTLSAIEALDGESKAQAVARVAALLPEDLVGAALAVAAGIPDVDDRVDALNALATRAPADLLLAVFWHNSEQRR